MICNHTKDQVDLFPILISALRSYKGPISVFIYPLLYIALSVKTNDRHWSLRNCYNDIGWRYPRASQMGILFALQRLFKLKRSFALSAFISMLNIKVCRKRTPVSKCYISKAYFYPLGLNYQSTSAFGFKRLPMGKAPWQSIHTGLKILLALKWTLSVIAWWDFCLNP